MKRNQLNEGWVKAGGGVRRSAVFGVAAGLGKIEEVEARQERIRGCQGGERQRESEATKVGKDRENQRQPRWGKTKEYSTDLNLN
jgi:hypothetical protein